MLRLWGLGCCHAQALGPGLLSVVVVGRLIEQSLANVSTECLDRRLALVGSLRSLRRDGGGLQVCLWNVSRKRSLASRVPDTSFSLHFILIQRRVLGDVAAYLASLDTAFSCFCGRLSRFARYGGLGRGTMAIGHTRREYSYIKNYITNVLMLH